ncbi:aquaporin [Patescibacteria group bacterium]|nr:aquaporin [Patescibacteria group bacterium]
MNGYNQVLKPLAAEAVGTLFLTLTIVTVSVGISASPDYQAVFLPAVIGLVLGLMVYIFGGVSGGHFNPAVTCGLFLARKVSFKQLATNVIGQIIGAYLGYGLAKLLLGGGIEPPIAAGSGAMLAEFVGAFILVLAVSAVVWSKVVPAASGLVIGGALTLGISIALSTSGGILNPAVALGLGAYHLSYLLMPFLGGGAAAGLAAWLFG